MRLNKNIDVEEMIIQAKIEMAEAFETHYGASLIEYIRQEDRETFLNWWKEEYEECYFCGDDIDCDHFVNTLEEKETTNE